jgi:hypothetical protein
VNDLRSFLGTSICRSDARRRADRGDRMLRAEVFPTGVDVGSVERAEGVAGES